MPPDSLPPHVARRRISANELAATIHARDAAAFFVEPRVLRRVIKLDRDINTLGLEVPHGSCYVIARSLLLEFVERDELFPAEAPPERVVLLPLPEADDVARHAPDDLVARYVRLLFHARVHLALEQRVAAGRLGTAALRERICRLGQTEFEEARAVLRLDDLLLPPRDDLQVYIELAATFLELDRFAPELLPQFFPAIREREAVAALFAEDLADDETLAALGRRDLPPAPPGAAVGSPTDLGTHGALHTTCVAAPSSDHHDGPSSEPAAIPPHKTAEAMGDSATSVASGAGHSAGRAMPRAQRLLRRAERIEDVGNLVRGTILRVRAAKAAAKSLSGQSAAIDEDSLCDLTRLATRLQQALGFDDSQHAAWEHSLRLLLRRCTDDRLTSEGRLLYDLQKVCVDHEREIFTVDLTEWLLSRGRQPIRRPLPAMREVLTCKHLRTALRRSHDVGLAEADRTRLAGLLRHALHDAEEAARQRLRPGIAESLRAVGIAPANVPEEVGRHKIVEELLDKAVKSGYLRFGDLRDAISRNNLKLPDLASLDTFGVLAKQTSRRVAAAGYWSWLLFPVIYFWLWIKHLLFGDHLLRADRELADRLDGVYHRAELYLRVFQRITSFGFGIGLGRLANRLVVLPLLGAFMVVSFYQELAHLTHFHHVVATGNLIRAFEMGLSKGWHSMARQYPGSVWWLIGLGVFFMGLLNSAVVRVATVRALKLVGRVLLAIVEALVRWLARPLIQAIFYNPWIVLARRYLLKPALFTLLVWLLLVVFERHPTPWALAGIFIGLNFLLNSRVGRNVEEITNDWLARAWLGFRARVVSGFYWLIVDLSKAFLEGVDRLLYAMDEWLRFRHGETRLSFAIKAVLGAVWFVVTYVVRFAINLLIEPQINPIKHFPVVTVSHKVVLALATPVGTAIAPYVDWEPAFAIFVCGLVGTMIPGIFGFLAWELKENWKLYAANRPATLQPVLIGHHGETMARLLCPGFHSGTVPKLFRKIRRAYRKADRTRRDVAELLRKPLDQLDHVRHALARYVEREFFCLLKQCPAWQREMRLGEIALATNRIRLELRCDELAREACWLSFEQQGGWLLADLEPGWTAHMPENQRAMLRDALVGLFKTSGVELLRPQIEKTWPGQVACYRVGADDRLVLWPTDPHAPEIAYPLNDGERLEPLSTADVPPAFPPIQAEQLLFSRTALPWSVWVEAWDRHARGASGPPLLRWVLVLPKRRSISAAPGEPSSTLTRRTF